MKRKTINSVIEFEGIGLHTGEKSSMKLIPAESGHGIKFKRVDLETEELIPADVNFVHSTIRSTNLQKSNIDIKTVEHVLSAIYALQIDDLLVELNGQEVPIIDGSAKVFVDKILEVGTKEQVGEREFLEIKEPFHYIHSENGEEFYVYPSDGFEVTTMIDFETSFIGQQHATISDLSDYPKEISTSRTFALASEVEELMQKDLIKGGTLSNALIFVDVDLNRSKWHNLSKKWEIEDVNTTEQGLINGKTLYHNNEPARHKLLDLLGDMALLTRPIKAKIIAKKPGHTANVAFTSILRKKLVLQRKLRGKPLYDPNKEPIFDLEQIKSMLPHRFPFLLVDKIIELSEKHVVGVKNVTGNEAFFQGHFPGNPVFPGVLQMEALAQTGGILALQTVDNPKEWDTYFLKMNNVKFKHVVLPGDTIIFKMELVSPIRRGLVNMQGTAYVGDKMVSEGELLAQIIKKK